VYFGAGAFRTKTMPDLGGSALFRLVGTAQRHDQSQVQKARDACKPAGEL
jgi:hypothetical protein